MEDKAAMRAKQLEFLRKQKADREAMEKADGEEKEKADREAMEARPSKRVRTEVSKE